MFFTAHILLLALSLFRLNFFLIQSHQRILPVTLSFFLNQKYSWISALVFFVHSFFSKSQLSDSQSHQTRFCWRFLPFKRKFASQLHLLIQEVGSLQVSRISSDKKNKKLFTNLDNKRGLSFFITWM